MFERPGNTLVAGVSIIKFLFGLGYFNHIWSTELHACCIHDTRVECLRIYQLCCFFASASGGVPWLHGYGKNARIVAKQAIWKKRLIKLKRFSMNFWENLFGGIPILGTDGYSWHANEIMWPLCSSDWLEIRWYEQIQLNCQPVIQSISPVQQSSPKSSPVIRYNQDRWWKSGLYWSCLYLYQVPN